MARERSILSCSQVVRLILVTTETTLELKERNGNFKTVASGLKKIVHGGFQKNCRLDVVGDIRYNSCMEFVKIDSSWSSQRELTQLQGSWWNVRKDERKIVTCFVSVKRSGELILRFTCMSIE